MVNISGVAPTMPPIPTWELLRHPIFFFAEADFHAHFHSTLARITI
jgi:hypothetical protein